jgi:anti-sigma28 factor (negative regulator of flagellin synthesis)
MTIAHLSHIQSPQHIQGLNRSTASVGQNNAEPVRQTSSPKDSITFSDEALRLSDVAQSSGGPTKIRFDLVNRIKAEISAGTYDTQDKMDVAIERMASRIF